MKDIEAERNLTISRCTGMHHLMDTSTSTHHVVPIGHVLTALGVGGAHTIGKKASDDSLTSSCPQQACVKQRYGDRLIIPAHGGL